MITSATAYLHRFRIASTKARQFALCAVLALSTGAFAPPARAAESAATGVIIGNVTNKATGNGLIGAKVEITALNLSALVDMTNFSYFNSMHPVCNRFVAVKKIP